MVFGLTVRAIVIIVMTCACGGACGCVIEGRDAEHVPVGVGHVVTLAGAVGEGSLGTFIARLSQVNKGCILYNAAEMVLGGEVEIDFIGQFPETACTGSLEGRR